MTTTVNSIFTKFGILANDVDSVQWTAAERELWINEGQIALLEKHPDAKIKTVTVALAQGAKQTNPADCISIIELRQNANGNAILPCDRKALDAFSPGWMTSTASATVKHYMDDPQPDTFYVYPPQPVSPGSVVMTYGAVPATVAAGGNIDVRDIYADRLVNYLIYRAYSKDSESGDAARAAAAYQLFNA